MGTPRIAHCIVGTVFETAWRQAHGSLSIYESKNYAGHSRWLQELRGTYGSIDVDLFVVLETRHMPRRSDFFVGGKDGAEGAGELAWLQRMQAAHGSNASLWPWNRTKPSLLRPMVKALDPACVVLYEANLQCLAQPCLCGHGITKGPTMAFWEMMAKNTACFQAIQEREARTGRPYDYVSKTRTDNAFIPAKVARRIALSTAAASGKVIYIGQSMNACHGGGDWAAFMPRALAPAYFNMSDDARVCSFVQRHGKTHCSWAVESYLWAWAEQHPLHPMVRHVG